MLLVAQDSDAGYSTEDLAVTPVLTPKTEDETDEKYPSKLPTLFDNGGAGDSNKRSVGKTPERLGTKGDSVIEYHYNFGYHLEVVITKKDTMEERTLEATTMNVRSDGTFTIHDLRDHTVEPLHFDIRSKVFEHSWRISENTIYTKFETATETVAMSETGSMSPTFNAVINALLVLIENDFTCELFVNRSLPFRTQTRDLFVSSHSLSLCRH